MTTACFRVVQEALTNVARHGQAREARVSVRKTETALEVSISDDGQGFDVAAARAHAAGGGSVGLASMEERVNLTGGTFDVIDNLRPRRRHNDSSEVSAAS